MAKKYNSVFEAPILASRIKSSSVKIFPEASFGYLIGPILAILCNGIINIWLIQYWDLVLGLGKWAPAFQIILPIVSSILIVVGNLLVGKILERKPSLAGKARPLLLISVPVIVIALLLLFLVPFPGKDGNLILPGHEFDELIANPNVLLLSFIALGYNLFYAFAWPLYYTSHSALVNLSTRDSSKRGLLSTCAMGAMLAASGVSGMAGGIIVDLLGLLPKYEFVLNGEAIVNSRIPEGAVDIQILISPKQANEKWFWLMIIMLISLCIGCLLEYYFTRERITEEKIVLGEANKEASLNKTSMNEQIRICFHDKYWWIIIIFFLLYQFGGQMKNNDMSFYSQAFTSGTGLSSLINTIGAIPLAVGMLLVWPIANKLNKTKTIILGSIVAVIAGAFDLFVLLPNISSNNKGTISIVSFSVKALGTAPAMYVSLALLGDVLDHQEAVTGKRTDGFTMAVYGSIMVATSGLCNGIIVGINSISNDPSTQKVIHTFLGYGVETLCYLIIAILFIFMSVEKFHKVDEIAIINDKKQECLANGADWIEPKEKARLEEEQNKALVIENHLKQLEIDCNKKHKNFEIEETAYLNAIKEKENITKRKNELKKQKQIDKYNALSQKAKDKLDNKKAITEEKQNINNSNALKELNALRCAYGNKPISLD